MQMKKVVVISMLAAALGTTAITPTFAAETASVQQSFEIGETIFIINANPVAIRTISDEDITLASVRDIANSIGASVELVKGGAIIKLEGNTVKVNFASNSLTVNGANQTLEHPLRNVNYTNFIDPASLVQALGGTYEEGEDSPSISTLNLLRSVEQAVWISASQLIVSHSIAEGRVDYLVDSATGDHRILLISSDTSELAVSPDATKAAYSDANGAVYVIDLSTRVSTKISTDDSIKNELQWAKDGSSLYFLQGDKSAVIAKINLTGGSVSKVLDDKVEYKANLDVSADGSKFAYSVFKQPKVTADSSKEVDQDDVAIDATGTEPQLFYFDSSVKESKPVQLTTGTDDKVFLKLAADGSKAYYVSVSNDDASIGKLVSVDKTGKTTSNVFVNKDVYQLAQSGTTIYLLTADSEGQNAIYSIDAATGASTLVQTVSDSVTEIIVSNHSQQIAALIDGKLAVSTNNVWKNITQ